MPYVKKTRIISPDEVSRKVLTVETFEKVDGKNCRWANNGNGTFRLIFPKRQKTQEKTVSELYRKIKIAVYDQRVVAMRAHPHGRLVSTNRKLS